MPEHAEGSEQATLIAEISSELHAERSEGMALTKICDRALEAVTAADHCGITVKRRRGKLETIAATDRLANACDELQYELGEGPCMEATLEHDAYLVRDTARDPRWPRWGPSAAEIGVRSIIAVHLTGTVEGKRQTLGAVNLYSSRVDAFSDDDYESALLFATVAGSALASARMVEGLETALHSRHLIGIAQGILMQRYQMDMDQAFEVLRRYSSHTNTKLRDLALQVVDQRALPGDEAALVREVESDPV